MRPFLGSWRDGDDEMQGVVLALDADRWPIVITDIGAVVKKHPYRGHLGFLRWVRDDEDPTALYGVVEWSSAEVVG